MPISRPWSATSAEPGRARPSARRPRRACPPARRRGPRATSVADRRIVLVGERVGLGRCAMRASSAQPSSTSTGTAVPEARGRRRLAVPASAARNGASRRPTSFAGGHQSGSVVAASTPRRRRRRGEGSAACRSGAGREGPAGTATGSTRAPASAAIASAAASACCVAIPPCLTGKRRDVAGRVQAWSPARCRRRPSRRTRRASAELRRSGGPRSVGSATTASASIVPCGNRCSSRPSNAVAEIAGLERDVVLPEQMRIASVAAPPNSRRGSSSGVTSMIRTRRARACARARRTAGQARTPAGPDGAARHGDHDVRHLACFDEVEQRAHALHVFGPRNVSAP